MLTTQLVRYAAAEDFPFMISYVKKGCAITGSTFFSTSSGMLFASKAKISSRKAPGLFIIFCAPFQSSFFFSAFSRNAVAAHTSMHSTGGLPSDFNSWMAGFVRQFTASFAASIAGIASPSSPSACALMAAASEASAFVFSASSLAAAFSTFAFSVATVTCAINASVAVFFSSTCTIVTFRSSFSPSTFSCTCSMMVRPFSSRSKFTVTFAWRSFNMIR
mmetsp:Transcript_16724/g.41387  ORF Transcript_16724/g.41387 Transcript_16724/m.41387 type:complete len:219 (+) Transcript_16724:980-1636(+)